MDNHVLSDEALAVLLDAGWSIDRRIDIAPIISKMRTFGYAVMEPVVEFCRSFSGLNVRYRDQRTNTNDVLSLQIIEYHRANLHELEWRMEKRLCPIGSFHNDIAVLLMSECGDVIADGMEYQWTVGETGKAAIDRIVLNTQLMSKI